VIRACAPSNNIDVSEIGDEITPELSARKRSLIHLKWIFNSCVCEVASKVVIGDASLDDDTLEAIDIECESAKTYNC
jgi:hypothetical protein